LKHSDKTCAMLDVRSRNLKLNSFSGHKILEE